MAHMTKNPTGLSISRSGDTFTFSWKIAAANHGGGQWLEYSVNGGPWTALAVGVAATSATVTIAGVGGIYFRVRGKRKKENNVTYEISDWSTCMWQATPPGIPTLTYTNAGTNMGNFTWSCSNDATSTAVFWGAEMQTCIERNAGDSWFAGAPLVAKAASGSDVIVEDSAAIAAGNFIRWYRIRAHGPGGYSPWATVSHAYGKPLVGSITQASGSKFGSVTRLDVSWSIPYNNQYPIDKITLQYAIAVPTDRLQTPPSSGWKDAIKLNVNGVQDRVVVNVDDLVDDDQCLWVRIVADHDTLLSYSGAVVAQRGKLKTPTIDAVPNVTTGSVDITITEETTCQAAHTAVYYRELSGGSERIVAVLQRGTTTATVPVPEIVGAEFTWFGAFAFLGNFTGYNDGSYSSYALSAVEMTSDKAVDTDSPAAAPASVTATEGPEDGCVRLSWVWSWRVATKAEISWADAEYAWESTNEPSKYTIETGKVTSWIVSGLEADKHWYFRVRLIDGSGDSDVVGPWSDIVDYDMSGDVDRPVLRLNKAVVNEGGTLVARWAYAASGNSVQAYAEVCLVTFDENTGNPEYGDIVVHVEQEQSAEIEQEWETGETYYLAVRVTATSGKQSAWSEAVSVFVAPPASITLESSNLIVGYADVVTTTETRTYKNDGSFTVNIDEVEETESATGSTEDFNFFMYGDQTIITVMYYPYAPIPSALHHKVITETKSVGFRSGPPSWSNLFLRAHIVGAGASGTTFLTIVRAEDYHIDCPDERNNDGYAGEIVAAYSQIGEGAIEIQAADIDGLYDGCMYYLIGKITDAYGQEASFRYPFWTNFLSKPTEPVATVEMDEYQRIAKITPGYGSTPIGTFDIYRISAEKPKLIYSGAVAGETYVDPYPAIGTSAGHRIVCVSAWKSHISNTGLAWYDTGVDDGDFLDEQNMIIDVDGEQIVLPYDIQLSNKWNKDFKRTSYLGGSVQGDWNPTVTRDITANTVLVRGDDLDRQISMRNLAGYAGIAHVRTPDGSSFACNVQIDEQQSYDSRKISYTLTMQAIDTDELDGMTLAEWEELHPVGE